MSRVSTSHLVDESIRCRASSTQFHSPGSVKRVRDAYDMIQYELYRDTSRHDSARPMTDRVTAVSNVVPSAGAVANASTRDRSQYPAVRTM